MRVNGSVLAGAGESVAPRPCSVRATNVLRGILGILRGEASTKSEELITNMNSQLYRAIKPIFYVLEKIIS